MMDYEADDQDWAEEYSGPSKSQVKRDLLALKALGKTLIELPAGELHKLDLPEDLLDAVVAAKAMSKGALKRQTGYIGRLIVEADYEAIQQKLTELQQPGRQASQQFHQLEQWRDRLLAGDAGVLTELRAAYPELDSQHLRQLVRNAQKEAQAAQAPKSARLLFKYLQQLTQDQ